MEKMPGGTRAFSSIRILARPWNEEEKALAPVPEKIVVTFLV